MRAMLPNLCVAKAAGVAEAAEAGEAKTSMAGKRNTCEERMMRVNSTSSCTLRLDRYSRGLRSSLANTEIKDMYRSIADASQSLVEDELRTVRMFDFGFQVVLKKVNEEAAEFVSAVCCEHDSSVCKEAADVIYHVLLLLRVLGLDLAVLLQMLKLRSG